jgi:spore germination cell wall hydrolase CwlJ-like protein
MIASLFCIASAIYFEARGEPIEGQAAVAWVIYHRTAAPGYPDTACDVVNEDEHRRNKCQFSFMCDGKREDIHDEWAYAKALLVTMATAGNFLPDPTGGATHYHAARVRPWWADELERTARIDNHIFYAETP